MRRLDRKDRRFDLIILDPPSFSKVGSGKTFQVKKDYTELVQLASQLMKPRGILLACCNLKTLSDSQFFKMIRSGAHQSQRSILQYHIAEQPADFPIHQNQPAHLKSIWTRLK
jgi:23S rRNA (cytosine1962-C5)-methyltransferase